MPAAARRPCRHPTTQSHLSPSPVRFGGWVRVNFSGLFPVKQRVPSRVPIWLNPDFSPQRHQEQQGVPGPEQNLSGPGAYRPHSAPRRLAGIFSPLCENCENGSPPPSEFGFRSRRGSIPRRAAAITKVSGPDVAAPVPSRRVQRPAVLRPNSGLRAPGPRPWTLDSPNVSRPDPDSFSPLAPQWERGRG